MVNEINENRKKTRRQYPHHTIFNFLLHFVQVICDELCPSGTDRMAQTNINTKKPTLITLNQTQNPNPKPQLNPPLSAFPIWRPRSFPSSVVSAMVVKVSK